MHEADVIETGLSPAETQTALDELAGSFFALFANRDGAQPRLEGIFELFVPEGIVARCSGPCPEVLPLDEFIAPRQALLTDGTLMDFAEVEISATTLVFGNMAQRLSSYEKSGVLRGRAFVARGLKTFQFVLTPAGWRISAVAWDDEREGLTLDDANTFTTGRPGI